MCTSIFSYTWESIHSAVAGELGRPRDGWRPGSDAVLQGRRDPWMATWWARHGLAWPGYRSGGGNVATTGWWLVGGLEHDWIVG